MTRAEIETEADKICSTSNLQPHARPLVIAWMEYTEGLPIDQNCPYCFESLQILDHGTAWTVTCPCGKSENTMRGL